MNGKLVERAQSEKFKEAARQIEADEDEARWEERLTRVAKSPKRPLSDEEPDAR